MQFDLFVLICVNYLYYYDHLYLPLISKKCKFQPQTNIFAGNNNTFFIKPTVIWVKISGEKNQFFRFEILSRQASK